MIFLLSAIFLLTLYRLRFSGRGFNVDYLSKEKTDSIKGIFILMIVITHSLGYINASSYQFNQFGDGLSMRFLSHLGQLVVVMFLFYSGYGVGESYKRKGSEYVKNIPRHRLLTTLLNFDVAIVSFILLWLALGVTFPMKQYLLSFTAWDEVGNSNWYIFVILCCYLFTYIALRLPLQHGAYQVAILFLLCLCLIVVLSICNKGRWWYDTVLSYPAGFLFSTYKSSFERLFFKSYWVILGVLAVAFIGIYYGPSDRFCFSHNVLSIIFAFIIVMVTMKASIGNPLLQWVGQHLFPIYIYMRLPMIFMDKATPQLIATQPAVFILVSLAITLVIAHCYRWWQIKL